MALGENGQAPPAPAPALSVLREGTKDPSVTAETPECLCSSTSKPPELVRDEGACRAAWKEMNCSSEQ